MYIMIIINIDQYLKKHIVIPVLAMLPSPTLSLLQS